MYPLCQSCERVVYDALLHSRRHVMIDSLTKLMDRSLATPKADGKTGQLLNVTLTVMVYLSHAAYFTLLVASALDVPH